MNPSSKLIKQYTIAIGFAIATALGIRIFFFEAFRVPTRTMHPALEPGDTVFVSKFPYLFKSKPKSQYGSIIVYLPIDEPYRHYIRRIIGLPGDTVSYLDGQVLLNGIVVTRKNTDFCTTESLPTGTTYSVCREQPKMDNFKDIIVPDGQVLVMGDLRSRSPVTLNGQNWALVPNQTIKANALFIWISIEPTELKNESGFFSRIRFNRFLKRVD